MRDSNKKIYEQTTNALAKKGYNLGKYIYPQLLLSIFIPVLFDVGVLSLVYVNTIIYILCIIILIKGMNVVFI